MFFEFRKGQELRKKVHADIGHSSGQEKKKKCYGTHTYKPEGQWNKTADVMLENFKESGHPIFRGISALNRRERRGGRCRIHFTVESPNAQLLFRTIHSANQLSIYGAVASWCGELAQLIPGQTHMIMEKSVAQENDQSSARSGFFGTDTQESL